MDAVAGPMLRQMKQAGINATFMGGDGICSQELPKLAAGSIADRQVICAEAGGAAGEFNATLKAFQGKYKAKFNTDVQLYAPYTYDAVMVMVTAMVKAGSSDPAKYLPVLAKTEGYRGTTGIVSFDGKGDLKNGAVTIFTYAGATRQQIAVVSATIAATGGGGDACQDPKACRCPDRTCQQKCCNEASFATVRVLFATDRGVAGGKSAHRSTYIALKSTFGAVRADVSYGYCDVSIPRDHRMGELEAPSVLRFEFRETPEKHVVLLGGEIQPKEEFFRALAQRIRSAPRSTALIFVHGYNVSFEDAARRTAQMAYDLAFDGAPVFYSWPSDGSTAAYPADEQAVEWTQTNLRHFLEDFLIGSGATNVYLIAHSMGSRALTRAAASLFTDRPDLQGRISEVILAAPDIDAAVFKRDIAPLLTRAGRPLTLYASSEDLALLASQRVHRYPRAGDSGPGLVVTAGVETIDATGVDTSLLGHSYFAERRSVLSDIFYIVHRGQRASGRFGLQPKNSQDGQYWAFRH